MQVVENVRKDRCLGIHDGIWICTFALNQFGDDLGSSLDRCPFVNGLTRSEHVCLVVDRQIGSLTRTWCAFELQLSADEQKTLDLYSPTGKVGTEGGASSVALLDAVEAWDIRDTDTSNAADRRQIFNRIAGVDELSGIQKDPEGRPLMDRGKKKLEDNLLDPAGRLRSRTKSKGKVEYAHEARLVHEQCSKFEAINSLVRGKVKESFAQQHECRGCRIRDHTLRGIPLGQLKKFFRQAMRELRGQWKDLTVQKLEDYVNFKLSPKIDGVKCSYVETVVEKPMPPTVYLAFASDGNVPELVKGVEWLAEARELDDDTAFFFEILCLSEDEMTSINTYSYHKVASSESQGILVAHGCDRAWVLCDLAYFLREDKFVDLGCPNGVLACTRPFRDNGFEYGQFCKTELQNILKLRCESVYRGHCSEAEFEYVKRCIAECFPNAPTPQEAYTLFEDALKQFACGPLMRSAAFHGDGHFMRKWCGAPGMLISNKSFRGSMGEMPVHIAAASGNVEALRTCLDLKADPNTEDTMRERPLHYAALAGSAPAVQVLLRANADPTVRSAFLETPLDVARENAAAYLNVNTEKIIQLLGSAEALERDLAQVLPVKEGALEETACFWSMSEEGWTQTKSLRSFAATFGATAAGNSPTGIWSSVHQVFQKMSREDGTMPTSDLIDLLSRLLNEDATSLVQTFVKGKDVHIKDFLDLIAGDP